MGMQSRGSYTHEGPSPAKKVVLTFGAPGNQYSGRSIVARDGNFTAAYRRLSGIMNRNKIRKELRLGEHHEKGSERRRRLKSERHRRRFAELVSFETSSVSDRRRQFMRLRYALSGPSKSTTRTGSLQGLISHSQ
jgi:ribosomal protein S21